MEDTKNAEVSKRAPRELIVIDGAEISLVDKPAIRRKFLIVKQEDGTVGIFQSETEDDAANTSAKDQGKDALEAEMEEGFALIAKSFEEAPDWEMVEVEKAKVPENFAITIGKAVPALRKAIKNLEGDERKSASAALSFLNKVSAGKFPFLKPNKASEKTTKSEDGMPEQTTTPQVSPSIQVSPDGTVRINGEPIAKAKQFTPERIESLKASLGGIAGLLMETAGIDAVKAALAQGLPSSDLPTDATLNSMVRPVATPGVKKAEDEAAAIAAIVTKAMEPFASRLEAIEKPADAATAEVAEVSKGAEAGAVDAITAAVAKAMEPFAGRLDAIEKTREPSKADDSDSTTDGKTEVVKSEGKQMWGNILDG